MTENARMPGEPEELGVRIRTHPGLCMGFGNCHRWGPDVYPLDEDGLIDIHVAEVPPELAAQARLGAQVCPNFAITVIELTDRAAIHSNEDERDGS